MNRILILAAVVVVLAGGAVLFGARTPEAPQDSDKLTVAASFYPLYFLASEIGGDDANVFNVTPAGAEPHDFEPTPGDLARIVESDLLITNGGDIDAWAADIEQSLTTPQVLEVGSEFMTLESEGHGHEEGEAHEDHEGGEVEGEIHELDPHIWLSPHNSERMADIILRALIELDPAHASAYNERAATLRAELEALDEELHAGFAQCARKKFVTSHAAFGYLAQEYDLTQIPISGISPEEEPSAQDLAEVTRLVKTEKIPVIFFETLVSPKLSETIASETGAQAMVLNPLEGLTDEEMRAGKSYLTEMRTNLTNLRVALECNN